MSGSLVLLLSIVNLEELANSLTHIQGLKISSDVDSLTVNCGDDGHMFVYKASDDESEFYRHQIGEQYDTHRNNFFYFDINGFNCAKSVLNGISDSILIGIYCNGDRELISNSLSELVENISTGY